MRRFFWIFILTMSIGQPSWAAKISLANLDSLEDIALYDRLERILQRQKEILAACAAGAVPPDFLRKSVSPTLTDAQRKDGIAFAVQDIRNAREMILDSPGCAGRNPIPSIRKPLVLRAAEAGAPASFWRALAPACFPVAGQGTLSKKENNACFAGDAMIFQDFKTYGLSVPDDTNLFSEALYAELMKTNRHGSLDVFAVFTKTFPGRGPREMWTLLAAFTTSGNSGLTGWLQGVEDQLLVADLNDPRLPDEQVYARSKRLQLAKITYQKFRDIADHFSVALKIFGTDLYSWNRHNFMAAYLGCRDAGQMSHVVRQVYSIGIGYESKDFVFHLLEGVRLRPSIQNFKEDTTRYKRSSAVGWSTCH